MHKYLATMTVTRYTPALDHGKVEVENHTIVGGINDGVPIEDFGMWILSDTPFPKDQDQLDQLFFDLVAESEGDNDEV